MNERLYITNGIDGGKPRYSHLVKVPEAARITGLPASLIRKSFICEEKRPKNIPSPPPHKRIGRSIFIIADQLSAWVKTLGEENAPEGHRRRRGRPTVVERIAQRQSKAD